MTVMEAIGSVDESLHNSVPFGKKCKWLSQVEATVRIVTGVGNGDASGYDENTPGDTQLLLNEPFDMVYPVWLEACIHYENGEYDRYNNAMAVCNNILTDFAAWVLRGTLPKSPVWQF